MRSSASTLVMIGLAMVALTAISTTEALPQENGGLLGSLLGDKAGK
jgi:hypothetical protein